MSMEQSRWRRRREETQWLGGSQADQALPDATAPSLLVQTPQIAFFGFVQITRFELLNIIETDQAPSRTVFKAPKPFVHMNTI